MLPWSHDFAGRLNEHVIDSQALTGNPLGDPHRRPLLVYTPPGYDAEPERRYPSIYVLQGLTGQVDMWRNRAPFKRNTPELIDILFAAGDVPPAIIVYVDAWTSLGGSQFVDSAGTGRYHTYLCDEVVAYVDAHYRTLTSRLSRGVTGKSSGGYGAMITPMLRPDLFAGLATHAGDALFEVCYEPDLREAARALRDHHDGSFDAFWVDFRARPGRPKPGDSALLNIYCMAACYSTDVDGTLRFPFELATGRLIPETWERWLTHDPVRMASRHAETLRGLRATWIDAGRSDDFYLDLGADAFHRELQATHPDGEVHFELFDGTHANIDWRYPMAVRFLAERLAG